MTTQTTLGVKLTHVSLKSILGDSRVQTILAGKPTETAQPPGTLLCTCQKSIRNFDMLTPAHGRTLSQKMVNKVNVYMNMGYVTPAL